MKVRWHCRVLEQELGPLDFADLVQLVRDGTLAADDRVRPEGAREWRAAETVVGLFHAARSAPSAMYSGAPEVAGSAPIATPSGALDGQASDTTGLDGGKLPRSRSPVPSADDLPAEASPLRRAFRASYFAALLLLGVWLGWSEWAADAQARRFPLPAALRERGASAGRSFLGWGPLSRLEHAVLWADVVAVAAFCGYLLWRPTRPSGR